MIDGSKALSFADCINTHVSIAYGHKAFVTGASDNYNATLIFLLLFQLVMLEELFTGVTHFLY